MSVVEYVERYEGETGTIDENGNRKYTRVFRVRTNDPEDRASAVIAGIPISRYSSYPEDVGSICRSVSAQRVGETRLDWDVSYSYDSSPFEARGGISSSDIAGAPSGGGEGSTPSDTNDNSTPADERPWTIEFGNTKSTKLLEKDLDDEEVVNSAGQPYSPSIEVPANNPTLKISGWVTTFDIAKPVTYQDAVNNATWLGLPACTWRCTDYVVKTVYDNGSYYAQFDITVEAKFDLWEPVEVLDAGTVAFFSNPASGVPERRAITDSAGAAINDSVPLDGSGHVLPHDGELVYNEFKVYRQLDFTQIV